MTDLEICEQLAERVHGWKIAPANMDARSKFFCDRGNYPCLDTASGDLRLITGTGSKQWRPFDTEHGWTDAMGLVRAHHGFQDTLFEAVYKAAEVDEYYESPGSWLLFKATPRDICLAMARASGIEVEG